MRRHFKRRKGFTLIDVALAVVILAIGSLSIGAFFKTVYDQLNPHGTNGGLRRYVMAEQMLRAQAEGLRLMRSIPPNGGLCRVVTEPAGSGFGLEIRQYPLAVTEPAEQLYYFDLVMMQGGRQVGTLSLSTLRRLPGGTDDKIGL